MKSVKENYPDTKFIIVATEFITPVTMFGREITRTFNFFGGTHDWKEFCKSQTLELVGKLPLYMYRRYRGFIECAELADLLIYVHPAIGTALSECASRLRCLVAPPMAIYPEIDPTIINPEHQLGSLPFGFTLTGTLTRYRKKIVKKLIKTFYRARYEKPLYLHVPFDKAPPAEFDRGACSSIIKSRSTTLQSQSPAAAQLALFQPNANHAGCVARPDPGRHQVVRRP
jgi:hypothetical protein